MGRYRRMIVKDSWYHIINEGISNHAIFESTSQRNVFFELLDDITRTYRLEIHAYALLTNEYQLLLRTADSNLSEAMRYLNCVFTQRYNRGNKRFGPLFRGRYKAILINADMFLHQVSRYIHWIPVKNGLSPKPDHYAWSSCRAYVGKEVAPTWLNRTHILQRFCEAIPEKQYKEYLDYGVDGVLEKIYANNRSFPILGPESFKNQIIEQLQNHNISYADLQGTCQKPSISEILEFVSEFFGENSLPKKIPENTVRNISMILCREIGGYSLKQIAEKFNINQHRSISVIINRTRKYIKNNSDLYELFQSLSIQINDHLC